MLMICDTCGQDITEEGIAWDGGKWCSPRCESIRQLDLFALAST
jgi:hypothetical protein